MNHVQTLVLCSLPVLGALASSGRRARWKNVLELGRTLRALWVLVVLAACKIFLVKTEISLGLATSARLQTAVGLIGLSMFCIYNAKMLSRRAKIGVLIAVLGAAANAVPMLLYGYMPVSLAAAATAGYSPAELTQIAGGYVRLSDVQGFGAFPGDLLPLQVLKRVVSFGDILLLLGVTVALHHAFSGSWRLSSVQGNGRGVRLEAS